MGIASPSKDEGRGSYIQETNWHREEPVYVYYQYCSYWPHLSCKSELQVLSKVKIFLTQILDQYMAFFIPSIVDSV